MAAQNSAGENSYEKSPTPETDIQQPGEAGDFGNGTETGHTKLPKPNAPPSREKSKSTEEGAAGSPRLPNGPETAPENGAEPSNPYSGT